MGECPDWYPLFLVAPKLNMSVVEAAQVDVTWIEWALMALEAEGAAREILNQLNS